MFLEFELKQHFDQSPDMKDCIYSEKSIWGFKGLWTGLRFKWITVLLKKKLKYYLKQSLTFLFLSIQMHELCNLFFSLWICHSFVLRDMSSFWSGRISYLFYQTLCVDVQMPFFINNFCVKGAEVNMVVFFSFFF